MRSARPAGGPRRRGNAALRILFVSSVGDLEGGAERSLLELARGLAEQGHTPTLAAWKAGELTAAFESMGDWFAQGAESDPARPLGGWTNRLPLLSPAVRLANTVRLWLRPIGGEISWLTETVRETGADVIHTNCDLSPMAAFGAARVTRVPWVAHVRDHWRSWFHPRIASALRSADAVVTPSAFLARRVSKRGLEPVVIPNPVSGDGFRRPHDDANGMPVTTHGGGAPAEKAFAVAVIGRLDEQKGTLRVAEVARWLVKHAEPTDPAFRFFVAGRGTGAFEARLRDAMDRAGVADRIALLGYRDDVHRWLPSMDALAVPSSAEPFGRMIVEGMHAAIPVVSFRDGAAPELLDHDRTGVLVPAGDVPAMASGLMGLARDPDRARRIGEAARAEARRFEPREVARRMVELYRTVGAA